MFNNPDWLTSCSSNTIAPSLHTQGLRHISHHCPLPAHTRPLTRFSPLPPPCTHKASDTFLTIAPSLHTLGLRHVSQRTPRTWSMCSMILMTSTSTGWSPSTRRESSEVSSTNILYSNDSLSIVRVTHKFRWVNFDKPENFCLVENRLWLYL